MFDDIGHGHRIHAASFGMIDGMERQKSVDFKDLPDPDGDSNEGLPIPKQVGRRASIVTGTMKRGSTYVGGVRGNDKRATQAPMSFPTAPSAFPKSPKGSSFPSVPESPTLSVSSSVVSEGSQGFEVSKKVIKLVIYLGLDKKNLIFYLYGNCNFGIIIRIIQGRINKKDPR